MVGTASAGGRGRWLAAVAAALTIAIASPVASQTSADDLARKHFESGVAYLEESDYPGALRAFEKAYELSKRHEILLNVATVHERSGDLPAAVKALKQYLEVDPNGKHADTVKLRISNLEKRIEGGSTPTADAGTVEVDAAAPAAPTSEPPPPPPPKERPVVTEGPNRVPAYIAFGVGGLATAGAIVTGVLAQGEYNDAKDRCSPNCTDDDVSSGKSLALTSTILTGVAIVGVSLGAVLWFTGDSPEGRPAQARHRRFDVRVGAGPASGRAEAIWRF